PSPLSARAATRSTSLLQPLPRQGEGDAGLFHAAAGVLKGLEVRPALPGEQQVVRLPDADHLLRQPHRQLLQPPPAAGQAPPRHPPPPPPAAAALATRLPPPPPAPAPSHPAVGGGPPLLPPRGPRPPLAPPRGGGGVPPLQRAADLPGGGIQLQRRPLKVGG